MTRLGQAWPTLTSQLIASPPRCGAGYSLGRPVAGGGNNQIERLFAPIDMNSKDYLAQTERDAKVVDALSQALRVMRLINRCDVALSGTHHQLMLEGQMLKIHEALLLLGVDSNEVL